MTAEKAEELWSVVKPLLRECYEKKGDLKGTVQLFTQMIIRSTSGEANTDFTNAYSEMIKNKQLSREIGDVSWSEFVRMLTYKADWYGKGVIKIDQFFPSSQLCNCCGYQNKDVKDLSLRQWECPVCHTKHDRDINAAINILNEGLKIA